VGSLQLASDGSPLDNKNIIFSQTLASGAALSVVREGGEKVLKLEHPAAVGSGPASAFAFTPSSDTFDDTKGAKVLLQYRVKLDNTNNITTYTPVVYFNRTTNSGNSAVQVRTVGTGSLQFNSAELRSCRLHKPALKR
jgi:hypothetical protein